MDKFTYAHDAFYGSMVGETPYESTTTKPSSQDFVAEWLIPSASDRPMASLNKTSDHKRLLNDLWHS